MHQSPTCYGAASRAVNAATAARRSPGTLWLLALLVLALALLNPLACLVHCLPRPVAVDTALSGIITAVCHIPAAQQADVPADGAAALSARAGAPQAAFAFIAPLLLVLLICSHRTTTPAFAVTAAPQVFVRPLAPPPR